MCCHVAVGHVCGVWYSRPRSTTGKNGKTLRSKRKCAKMVSILVPRPRTVCDDWWVMIKDERTSVRCLQGSVLGPILYTYYTHRPLGTSSDSTDSITISTPMRPSSIFDLSPPLLNHPALKQKIEAFVSEIDSWMVCNKLKLNRERRSYWSWPRDTVHLH